MRADATAQARRRVDEAVTKVLGVWVVDARPGGEHARGEGEARLILAVAK
jgi:hypothetical protein